MKKTVSCVVACLALTSFGEAHAMTGKASYYGGRGRTASGGHVGAMTCAHRSLPFGTLVRVTNLSNHRSAVVTVNDRGPFVRGRIIDVSSGAANVLGMRHAGVASVSIEIVSRGMRRVDATDSAPGFDSQTASWNPFEGFASSTNASL